ncbi:MAG: phosphatase PAP2 family protein [Chitinophagaceae bacterium]|nr:MAG: phosphatase PAP2 family protein [Chitinophagaceae bacterium]
MRNSKGFLRRYLEKLSGSVLLLLLLFVGALGFFVYIMHEVLWEKEEEIDLAVFAFLAPHRDPGLTAFMKSITYCASSTFLQIGYGILVLSYLLQKNWKRAVEIGVVGIGGYAINYFMKLSFQRQRPPGPLIDPLHNFSFPSGHATSAFIFYGLLVYLISKTKLPRPYKYGSGVLLIAFALLIGFSRVYLRVHYASDVVAGLCIGAAWLLLAIGLMERLKKKSDREATGGTAGGPAS